MNDPQRDALDVAMRMDRELVRLRQIQRVLIFMVLLVSVGLYVCVLRAQRGVAASPALFLDNSASTPEVPATTPTPEEKSETIGYGSEPEMLLKVNHWSMEAPEPGPWKEVLATGYAHGCTNPRSGVEPATPQPTASRQWPRSSVTIAAQSSLAFGTLMEIRYRNHSWIRSVEDRGPDIVSGRIDIYFDTCLAANEWGRRTVLMRVRRLPLGAM